MLQCNKIFTTYPISFFPYNIQNPKIQNLIITLDQKFCPFVSNYICYYLIKYFFRLSILKSIF